jgi:hypothetical protein
MNANQLRLGNWVSHNGRPYQVSILLFAEFYAGVRKIEDFEAIELSHEWLDRFGFEGTQFLIAKGNFTYNCQTKILTWFGIMLHDSLWNKVHQLQNIYHALTGKEL